MNPIILRVIIGLQLFWGLQLVRGRYFDNKNSEQLNKIDKMLGPHACYNPTNINMTKQVIDE